MNARQLREVEEVDVKDRLLKIKRHPIYFILENVYDTYNVGGLFRLADALAIEKMYLCGEMEIPPNPRIKKASIGTYKIVPWEYKRSAPEAIADLRKAYNVKRKIPHDRFYASPFTLQVVAVEQSAEAVDYTKAQYSLPLALVMGNETTGITEKTLKEVDKIVEIPMWGINKSLNVIVSAAIVSYFIAGANLLD